MRNIGSDKTLYQMKFLLCPLFFLTCCVYAYAQKSVVKFCEVTTREVGFGTSKLKVELVLGHADSASAIAQTPSGVALKKVVALTNAPDILEYMYKQGWSLVTVIAVAGNNHFYFKKEYSESELGAH